MACQHIPTNHDPTMFLWILIFEEEDVEDDDYNEATVTLYAHSLVPGTTAVLPGPPAPWAQKIGQTTKIFFSNVDVG